MISDLDNSLDLQDLPIPFFDYHTPNLTPFMASLSPQPNGSFSDFNDFKLQNTPLKQSQFSLAQFNEVQESHPIVERDQKPYNLDLDGDNKLDSEEMFKAEIQTPSLKAGPQQSKIREIIKFLVQNSDQSEEMLRSMAIQICNKEQNLINIYEILLRKFKKLRKTKEEMIKYCMRKAFKFVSDLQKPAKKSKHDKPLPHIEMPFRKNSLEKTMNSQYLKQVFGQQQFVDSYQIFLNQIKDIIGDDNNSKVTYLSETIDKMMVNGQLRNIEGIKRLPWPRSILIKTEEVAVSLLSYSNNMSVLENQSEQAYKY